MNNQLNKAPAFVGAVITFLFLLSAGLIVSLVLADKVLSHDGPLTHVSLHLVSIPIYVVMGLAILMNLISIFMSIYRKQLTSVLINIYNLIENCVYFLVPIFTIIILDNPETYENSGFKLESLLIAIGVHQIVLFVRNFIGTIVQVYIDEDFKLKYRYNNFDKVDKDEDDPTKLYIFIFKRVGGGFTFTYNGRTVNISAFFDPRRLGIAIALIGMADAFKNFTTSSSTMQSLSDTYDKMFIIMMITIGIFVGASLIISLIFTCFVGCASLLIFLLGLLQVLPQIFVCLFYRGAFDYLNGSGSGSFVYYLMPGPAIIAGILLVVGLLFAVGYAVVKDKVMDAVKVYWV